MNGAANRIGWVKKIILLQACFVSFQNPQKPSFSTINHCSGFRATFAAFKTWKFIINTPGNTLIPAQ